MDWTFSNAGAIHYIFFQLKFLHLLSKKNKNQIQTSDRKKISLWKSHRHPRKIQQPSPVQKYQIFSSVAKLTTAHA